MLTYSIFAPTLLRVAVAIAFLYGAYAQFHRFDELSRVRLPLVGGGAWIITCSIFIHAIVGGMLLLGYYTQIAALVGAVGALKGIAYAKRYPRLFVFCRLEYFYIAVICLSLLLTGAGALAFDIRL